MTNSEPETFFPQELIRNFSIIAHIDHGKSTLADRILSLTGALSDRQMRDQYLDSMDIERERGITIKSQAVTVNWEKGGKTYALSMIDTPGHVDFNYEVSRALAACEGCVLLVDATQGIEAQTLSNLYLALQNDLAIIPVLNKIDLPGAKTEEVRATLCDLLGVSPEEVMEVSAKTGVGVKELLDAIVEKVPAPSGDPDAPTRALIFDSQYDAYRGIITYIRLVDGRIEAKDRIIQMKSGSSLVPLELGIVDPFMRPVEMLTTGQVGYVITGIKDVRQAQVGDTITCERSLASEPLKGYKAPESMVYAGIFPLETDQFPLLRQSLDKLRLNDASISYTPETSSALGFGFRCGFLGLLHMQIVIERLEREFGLELISTAPNVHYRVEMADGSEVTVTNPTQFPENKVKAVYEPVIEASIITPKEYVGDVMKLCQEHRGKMLGMEYLGPDGVCLRYKMPTGEIIFGFFDQLKSRTKGYATLDYAPAGEEKADLVRVDILIHGELSDALSAICHKDKAYEYGLKMTKKLKKLIPRQQFEIPIQAAIGQRVIARETISPLRKDVLAKCYGGDITRKRKLLEKQREGKKKMKMIGNVAIPQEAFISALSLEDLDDKDIREKLKAHAKK
ncbi:MAG: elongation factor 4 [Aeriscardovia sp.]|nr:elongation factor 4 [Aeriscardovia sp.]